MQPTPLCGPEIVAILNAGFSPIATSIYCGGAADGQAVRRLFYQPSTKIDAPRILSLVIHLSLRGSLMAIRAHLFGLPDTDIRTGIDFLAQFATRHHALLHSTPAHAEDFDVFALLPALSGHLCLFSRWSAWFDLQTFLLHICPGSLLCFHIYEHDYWQYELVVDGVVIDQYISSLAFYPPQEQPTPLSLELKSQTLRAHWPVDPRTSIDRYFMPWQAGEYLSTSRTPKKAYPDDRFTHGDMWQVADVMNKLGLAFPIAADGTLLGQTYSCVSRTATNVSVH